MLLLVLRHYVFEIQDRILQIESPDNFLERKYLQMQISDLLFWIDSYSGSDPILKDFRERVSEV